MAEEVSVVAEKFSRSLRMRELIAAVAGPKGWDETRERWLERASRKAGITYRAAKAIFYSEIADPEHRAVRRLAAAARLREKERQARADTATSIGKLVALRASLAAIDPEFHREAIGQLDEAIRVMGGDLRDMEG